MVDKLPDSDVTDVLAQLKKEFQNLYIPDQLIRDDMVFVLPFDMEEMDNALSDTIKRDIYPKVIISKVYGTENAVQAGLVRGDNVPRTLGNCRYTHIWTADIDIYLGVGVDTNEREDELERQSISWFYRVAEMLRQSNALRRLTLQQSQDYSYAQSNALVPPSRAHKTLRFYGVRFRKEFGTQLR